MMDKILIRDLAARGRIGVPEDERVRPQELLINLVLEIDTRKTAETDDISHSVNYASLTKKVLNLVEVFDGRTVERLAEEIAALCLTDPNASAVTVRVEKTSIVRFTAAVGVEIYRRKTFESSGSSRKVGAD